MRHYQLPIPVLDNTRTSLTRASRLAEFQTADPSARNLRYQRRDENPPELEPVTPKGATGKIPPVTGSDVTVIDALTLVDALSQINPTTLSPSPVTSSPTSSSPISSPSLSPTPSPISSPTASPDSYDRKTASTGPIIGGIIGSVVFLGILFCVVLLYRLYIRRERLKEATSPSPFPVVWQTSTPFDQTGLPPRTDMSRRRKPLKSPESPQVPPNSTSLKRNPTTITSQTTQGMSQADYPSISIVAENQGLDQVSSVGATPGYVVDSDGGVHNGSDSSINKPRRQPRGKARVLQDATQDTTQGTTQDTTQDMTQNTTQGRIQDRNSDDLPDPSVDSAIQAQRNPPPAALRLRQVVNVMHAMRAEIEMLRGQFQGAPGASETPNIPPPSYVLDE